MAQNMLSIAVLTKSGFDLCSLATVLLGYTMAKRYITAAWKNLHLKLDS